MTDTIMSGKARNFARGSQVDCKAQKKNRLRFEAAFFSATIFHLTLPAFLAGLAGLAALVAVFLEFFLCFLLAFRRSRLISRLTPFTYPSSFFSPNSCL